jgi:clan AA aspartic protease (TIGR02281 family)
MTERRLITLAVLLITLVDFFDANALFGQNQTQSIPFKVQGGTFVIPVLINGQITLNFTIDSGATDVMIPADVVITLSRTGTLQKSDFIGKENFRLANGSIVPSTTFLVRSLKVGNYLVENVKASIVDPKAGLLLGQSFLSRFASWSVDNNRQVLLLNAKPQQQQVQESCPARIPSAAQHFTGLVTHFLTDEQVLAATRSVEAELGAKVNPGYLRLKHASVRGHWQNANSETMAAIPEHMSVKIGDKVELNSRYRDPSLPCHFIPWTINRLIAQP